MTTLLPIALGLLLQSTALLLLGLVAMRLARRRGPAVQTLLGRATLAGVWLALLVAGPLAGHIRPVWRIRVSEAQREPTPRQVASPPKTGGGGVKTVAEDYSPDRAFPRRGAFTNVPSKILAEPVPKSPKQVNPATILTTPPPPPVSGGEATCRGAGSLWATGTALLLLWLALCQRHLTRLRRSAHPVPSGPAAEMLAALTTRPPALLTHPSVRSPFLAGLWRPAIFLPTTYEVDFEPTTLRAILAHELTHLTRRDNTWTLAARLLSALLWPQLLVWVLCRRLEQIGEEACDLAVLTHDCPPHAYADCLLTLAERHPLGRRERALGVGVAPFRSSLGRRIARILDKGAHTMSTITPRLRLTIAALTVAAALGGAFLISSAPAQSTRPAPATKNAINRPTPESLARDLARMQKQVDALSPHTKGDNQLNQARFLAGLTPVRGPGVVVTLNDSHKTLPNMPPGSAPPNLIHDTDINQVVNELKAAGAEAITVNDQRLVATSPVRDAGPVIFVNNIPQTPPYVIKAIGNPTTLIATMKMQWGVASQLRAYDSAMISVKQSGSIRLPAYTGEVEPRFAKPASFNAPSTADGKGAGERRFVSSANGAVPTCSQKKIRQV